MLYFGEGGSLIWDKKSMEAFQFLLFKMTVSRKKSCIHVVLKVFLLLDIDHNGPLVY